MTSQKDGHTLLGLHANAGITFDVAALRKTIVGQAEKLRHALRFTAMVGYFGAVGNNDADAWVFVDGQKVAEFRKLRRDDGLQRVDVELPVSARFLSLLSTDGGNGFGMDQIGFGDPQLKTASPPALTDKTRKRLAELNEQRERVEAELATLGPPPRFYGVVAEKTIPEVRMLTRGNPETPSGDALSPAAFSLLAMLDPELGALETSEGKRRTALARWITHPEKPAGSSSHRQSFVAMALWYGAGGYTERFWLRWRSAYASRASRLARGRIGEPEVVT